MLRRFSANFAVFSIFLDMLLVDVALLVASALRAPLSRLEFVKEIAAPIRLPLPLYLIFPVMWVGVFLLFSVYDGRKNLRVVDEFGSLTLGAMLAGVAMAGVLYFSYRDVSRFLFLLFVFTAFLLTLIWRAAVRLAYRLSFRAVEAQARRVLILGAGELGRRVGEQICAQSHLGLKLVGYLADDEELAAVQNEPGGPGGLTGGPGVLSTLDCVRQVVLEKRIHDVIVALPLSAHARVTQVVSELHDLPVQVRVVPDYFSLTLHRASVEDFAGMPMLDLRAPALSEYQRMVKRGFDLLVCLVGLPLVLPVMGLVALAIKLDSKGPIFYFADRVGENGRPFKMLKFRTMVENADKMDARVQTVNAQGQVVFKTPHDPRVTRVGRFLRRTSLDELPQLFNVLAGDMSLVGPRPELPALVEQYASWQRKRFVVPQGMTGWWQINGRSDKPMHLHTEEDIYYVQHYSIWLDLQILARTVWAVLRGKGAY